MSSARLPETFLDDVADRLTVCEVNADEVDAELLALARKELPGLLPEDPAPLAATDG